MDKIKAIIQQIKQKFSDSEQSGDNKIEIKIQAIEVVELLNEIKRVLLELKSSSSDKKLPKKIRFIIEIEFKGKTGEEIRQEADIDFFNSLALFIYLRRYLLGEMEDNIVFNFPYVTEDIELSFASYLYRVLFYVIKNVDNLFLIRQNGSEDKKTYQYRSRVFGGWGETGLPIIPINNENFQVFGANVFSFIAKKEVKFETENKKYKIKDFITSVDNKTDELVKDLDIDKKEKLLTPWVQYEEKGYSPIYLYCIVGIQELLNKCKDDFVLEHLQYMNVLTFLLFYAAYKGIYSVEDGSRTAAKRREILTDRKSFIDLYQTCNDYSMGIMQLMENVLAHAKTGIFTFRSIIRSSPRYAKQVSGFYEIPQNKEEGWDFLQIYIADIAKETINEKRENVGYKKLTDVFQNNLVKRNKRLKGKKTKVNNLSIKDIFWPTEIVAAPQGGTDKSAKEEVEEDNSAVNKTEGNRIGCEEKHTGESAGKESDSANLNESYASYNEYLKDSENIAHHYGLQIFVFSVLNHKGNFTVVSGGLDGVERFDTSEIVDAIFVDKEGYPYKQQHFDYYAGTCYAVRLPIGGVTDTTKKAEGFIPVDFTFGATDDAEILQEIILNKPQEESKQSTGEINQSTQTNNESKQKKEVKFDSWEVKDGIVKKEKTVKKNKIALIKKTKELLKGGKKGNVLVVNIDHVKKNYIAYEILAKTLFSFVSYEDEKLPKNIIIKTFQNSATVAVFLSFYSQFYDRFGKNDALRSSPQIMLVYNTNTEGGASKIKTVQNAVVLAGRYLGKPLYNYTAFSGGDDNRDGEINLMLSRIGRPSKNQLIEGETETTKNNPHYFDDFVLENEEKGGQHKIKKWQRDLKKILETEITDEKRYGVLIKNQHVHVSGVHLDRFYKVESLFTNAYWSKKFAIELNEIVNREIADNGIKKVILYGYERLIEPLFINAKNLYNNKSGKEKPSMDYLIFDAGYHYTARKTAEPKIGGLNDSIIEDVKKESTLLIYVMSISTTCRTFETMKKLLEKATDKKENKKAIQAKERYCAIIQLFDTSERPLHGDYFDFGANEEEMEGFRFNGNIQLKSKETGGKRIESKEAGDKKNEDKETENKPAEENKTNEKTCRYLIAVPAVWSNPQECQACFPGSEQEEKAIYSTDDTSLVPVFMIEKEKEKKKYATKAYQFDFFETADDGTFKFRDALLYGHTVRGDSHYKSYIKSDILLERLKSSSEFEKKFHALKTDIEENVKKSGKSGIDIIIAPYHNTNQAFPALINEKVFDGNAHIISFNVAKIFRSNFNAEFDGYTDLIRKIKRRNPKGGLHNFVRFYYVDDQINSGQTFYRTKSLVRSFVEENIKEDTIGLSKKKEQDKDFDFNAIIVLADRHSDSTKESYIQQGRYYSLFRFLSPNLRSGGDMCPLCKQVALDHDYLEKASLSSTAEFCVKRMLAHKAKEISEKENQKMSSQLLDRGMRRVLTEEAIYKAIDFSEGDSAPVDIYDRLVSVIDDIIKEEGLFRNLYKTDDKIIEKIEYLISFVKSLSRPFFTYRPTVATATVKLLKRIVEGICDKDKKNLIFGRNRIEIDFKTRNGFAQAAVVANLLLACVSGLANLNSTYLLNLAVTDKILLWFNKNKKCLKKDESDDSLNIFTYYPDKTNDPRNKGYNADRSFADYLRMAIFRILRAEPYGKFRREKYDTALLEYLQNTKLKKEQIEQLKEQIEFYSLVYLENGPLDAKDNVDDGIDVLRERMLWKYKNAGQNVKDKISRTTAEIIAKSEPYVINEYDRLVPLTEEGYRDAFESGYEIEYNHNNDDYYPVVSAYDKEKMQLSGMLQLEEGAFRLLKKTGISISFSDEQKFKPKYVFVLLRYFIIDDEQGIDDKEKEEQENGEKKAEQGKEERQLQELVLRFNIDDLKNISGDKGNTSDAEIKKQADTALMCGLRRIVILRREFIEKIGDLLNNDALRRLVSTSEEKRALSLSKAAKHGNSRLEETTAKQEYIVNSDGAFITIQKLLANRMLSETYRIESENYEKELDSVKGAKNPLSFILPQMLEKLLNVKMPDPINQHDDPMETIIASILSDEGLKIKGKYEDEENDGSKAELNINIAKNSWLKILESAYNEDQSLKLLWDDSLCYIEFCQYPGNETQGHEKRRFVYLLLLLAYNALRHSKYYKDSIVTNRKKCVLIDIENEKNMNYLVCKSYNLNDGVDHVEEAKKSIAIPPWTRRDKNGITLWSISRYIKRCWYYKENKKHDTLNDIFQVTESIEGKYRAFKIKIRIK